MYIWHLEVHANNYTPVPLLSVYDVQQVDDEILSYIPEQNTYPRTWRSIPDLHMLSNCLMHLYLNIHIQVTYVYLYIPTTSSGLQGSLVTGCTHIDCV